MTANGLGRNNVLLLAVTYHYCLRWFHAKSLNAQAEDFRVGLADSYYGRFYYVFEEVVYAKLC